MFSENQIISPEQRAKFMTASQIDNLGVPEKKPKKWLPYLLGVTVAIVIVMAGDRFLSNRMGKQILYPFVSPNSKVLQGPTVENPLNGIIYKESDAATWINERPIGVMINNHGDARPQSGLIDADIVYEVVAEGGITRFLGFFLSTLPEKIGPVRSTREYYLVIVKELGDAMLMHIGYSPQALQDIETWPIRSLFKGGAQFWRDQARLNSGIATEHTAYVSGPDLRKLGVELGWDGKHEEFIPWKFKNEENVDKSQQCLVGECDKPIVIDFWAKGDYTGAFKYDRATNSYLRFSGYDTNDQLIPLLDQESKKQLAPKTVVVQFVKEFSIPNDDKNRLDYELIGSGQGIVFIDGKAIKAVWRKAGRDAHTVFYDTNGQEILFNRGKIWVSIVPDRNIEQVTY